MEISGTVQKFSNPNNKHDREVVKAPLKRYFLFQTRKEYKPRATKTEYIKSKQDHTLKRNINKQTWAKCNWTLLSLLVFRKKLAYKMGGLPISQRCARRTNHIQLQNFSPQIAIPVLLDFRTRYSDLYPQDAIANWFVHPIIANLPPTFVSLVSTTD